MAADFDRLAGAVLAGVRVSEDGRLIVDTADGWRHSWEPVGDCCAHCWIEHLGLPGDVVGAEVLEASVSANFVVSAYSDEVAEQWHQCLRTTRGVIDVELRVEHSGYYGGSLEYRGKERL